MALTRSLWPLVPQTARAAFDVVARIYAGAEPTPARVSRREEEPNAPGPLADGVSAQLRAEQAAAALLLDRVPFALYSVDADAVLHFTNGIGSRMLAAGDRLSVESERLVAAHPDERDGFRLTIRSVAQHRAVQAETLRLTSLVDARRFGVLAFAPSDAGPGAVVLLVADPAREQAIRALLRSMFGLTRSEAELCLLVLQGLTVEEAASERRVAASTARAALKSAEWKTGSGGTGALMQVLQAASVLPLVPSQRGFGL